MRHLPIVSVIFWAVGGLLAVSAGECELTIRDTIGRSWENEPIEWAVSCEPGAWKDATVLLTRDGKAIPAQPVVEEKHADGSIKKARILFLIDKLEKDAATSIRAVLGQAGPVETDLKVEEAGEALVLSGKLAAVKVLNRNAEKATAGEFSPILGVRTASGKWAGSGRYATSTCKPTGTKTELIEQGPVHLRARVTTPFDNGKTHVVIVSLWSGARAVDIEEEFNLGPDDKYRFKEYKDDRDELCWEWWSWYGDKDGVQETHPNNWVFQLSSDDYQPVHVRYRGESSTDSAKGEVQGRGESKYNLTYDKPRRLEKYLTAHDQWRPDAVTWYCTSPSEDPKADSLAVFSHSARLWRNPNVLPAPQGITLRTGANDMRIWSEAQGKKLLVECPIGLGHRAWAIRTSTREETSGDPSVLSGEIVKRCLGLNIARTWVTDWPQTAQYPHLFIQPKDKDAYYARLRGQGIGSPGNFLDTFLRDQNQAGFDKDYQSAISQANQIVSGYFGTGCDISNGYPGWMLGYWHGISVATALDNLAGSPLCKPEQAQALRKRLAICTYALVSRDAWPDKQINYGWGSMNMPVGRWGGLVVMASALSDHPMAKEWLKDANRYFSMLLKTEYAPDGTAISCPHYIGASATSFYAWIAMANSGIGEDVSKSPVMQKFARYYMQIMTPIDSRWGIRTLLTEGDSRPGSSPIPAILGTLLRKANPELAGQLMQMWREGGSDLSGGMGVPDNLIIDPAVPVKPLTLGPEVFPGFGTFLRYRQLGTPEEAYLAFLAGNFMIDHANTDALAFEWYEKGVPLSTFCGSMYEPMTCTALSHNTVCWDFARGGGKDPGKDQAGNWYNDRKQPFVDLGGKTPNLHWEVGFDRESQSILETRGNTTVATDLAEAALVEGRVSVKALAEMPTRPDNYAVAVAAQSSAPIAKLAKPFPWTRRLLYVKAPTAAGMNYLVIRDDFGGFRERTPFFQYWCLSDEVKMEGQTARFKGQFGVDTDLVVLEPQGAKLEPDSFTHHQCEGNVAAAHQKKFGKAFGEKTIACRVEGKKDQGFLAVLFPRKANEPAPTITPWADGKGVQVSWKGETHRVLLDMAESEINADGIKAKTSCLVLKTSGQDWSLSLPAGGTASIRESRVEGKGPVAAVSLGGKVETVPGKDLMAK